MREGLQVARTTYKKSWIKRSKKMRFEGRFERSLLIAKRPNELIIKSSSSQTENRRKTRAKRQKQRRKTMGLLQINNKLVETRNNQRVRSVQKSSSFQIRWIFPILVFALALNKCAQQADAQCPVNTMTSFERISGVTVKDSLLSVLYTAPGNNTMGHHMLSLDMTRQLSGINNMNSPITAECNNRCRRSIKCRAFLVDYARHTCYSIEQSPTSQSSSGLMRTPTPIHLVPTQERTSYFEKVCLNLPPNECERAWIFERVMAFHVHGHDDKLIDDVPSRLKCQEHCLNEHEFRCRSGEYDSITMQCRLSMIDRHIKPNSFRPTTSNVDYFENQCVPVGNQCDAFDRFDDMDLGRAEIMRLANTSDQCQQFCTQTLKAFICRSFTWNSITGKCYLNSANTFMVGGLDRLISAPGLTYFQRNDCIDLKLECDTTAMTLNLRTNEPFRGRMYVRDDPNACETVGRSSLVSSLSIPFQSHARCATRELPSRYSSVVVVQQHPLIQRKSDRYIKVVCDFQTANKTITSTYNVVGQLWPSTALINATSFAPKIRLRITDRQGIDITGAKLGDELFLRIEAETESVYDMVARSVLAKSGTTDESIALIDKDGCPTDYRIFPPLKKLNRRTIIGKFDAFKFSSDIVVRFQVDVQFCLNQCPTVSCEHNLLLNSNTAQLADSFTNQASNHAGGNHNAIGGATTSSPASPSTAASMLANAALLAPTSMSSTQAPQVPFQQRTTSDMSGHRSPIANFSSSLHNQANSHYHHSSGSPDNSPYVNHEPAHIYYNPANQLMNNRHPSVAADLANFTSGHSILESLSSSGGDPQMFEHSQPRSAPLPAPKSAPEPQQSRQQQQQLIDSPASAQVGANEDDSVANANQRRRRRSVAPLPPAPRHVPLHREIIVSDGSGATQTDTKSTSDRNSAKQRHSMRDPKTTDRLNRNGPSYDFRGKSNSDNHPIILLPLQLIGKSLTSETKNHYKSQSLIKISGLKKLEKWRSMDKKVHLGSQPLFELLFVCRNRCPFTCLTKPLKLCNSNFSPSVSG